MAQMNLLPVVLGVEALLDCLLGAASVALFQTYLSASFARGSTGPGLEGSLLLARQLQL